MTSDEFDSLRRGDVVRWDNDGALGLVVRRGLKHVCVLWEEGLAPVGTSLPSAPGKVFETPDDAGYMTIIATARSAADL